MAEIFGDFYRFLKFWFVDSLKFFFEEYLKNSAIIERKFSLRLNLKHFFEPLYGIYSIEAYFYALPLRISLIFISIFLHLVNIFFIFMILLFWLTLPFLLTLIINRWASSAI